MRVEDRRASRNLLAEQRRCSRHFDIFMRSLTGTSMPENNKYVPELDGLRGIAAIAVIVSHCANAGFVPQFLGRGFGQQGVALFYVLSGYLIFGIYLSRDFNINNAFRYAMARFYRVLPLFYAAMIFSSFFYIHAGIDVYYFETMRGIVKNALLIQGTSVLWSIPIEIQFYVVFIGIWWLQSESRRFLLIFALVIFQFALLTFFDTGPLNLQHWLHFFLIGGLFSMKRFRVNVAGYFAFIFLLLSPFALPEIRKILGWPVLPAYCDPITAGYPIIFFLLSISGVRAFSFLGNSILRYLGKISFGTYLLHWPLIKVAFKLELSGFMAFAFIMAITLLLASVSLFLYERPVQKLLCSTNRLGPRPS